jgi:hypothetical protein
MQEARKTRTTTEMLSITTSPKKTSSIINSRSKCLAAITLTSTTTVAATPAKETRTAEFSNNIPKTTQAASLPKIIPQQLQMPMRKRRMRNST